MPQAQKKSRVTSVTIMIISIVLLMIASLAMFFPNIKTAAGASPSAADIFWPNSKNQPVGFIGIWPVFIGYMFIFLCGVGTLVLALPVIHLSYKLEKTLLITFTALEVVGAILVALINVFYCSINGFMAQLMDTTFYWGAYLAVFCTLIAAGLNIYAIYLDR
ncbi:MAG: hypothetical protein LUD22_02245 [Coprobacillus sp.]|nr:hypothetical protein [Coprobacillus sp.]